MDNLISLRKSKGLTQKELAKKINIVYQTYNSYETNKVSPPIQNLIILADFFGCTIDYLVGRENEEGTIVFMGNQTSKDENKLLDITRTLNPIHKEMLYRFAEYLKTEEKEQKK